VSGLPAAPVGPEAAQTELAAWSIVHGFANLWLGGALRGDQVGDDPEAAARLVITRLFTTPG
jgi:hypothetical protein